MSEVFFGNTTASTGTVAANFVYFFPATCTQSGNVTHMRMKSGSATGINIKLAVYSSSAGAPASLLGSSDAITINATSTVFTAAVSSPFAVVSGTAYFLAWVKNGGNDNVGFASTGSDYFLASTYPTFPGSAAGASSSTGTGYIEAGVTPSGGTTFVPLIAIL